MTSSLFHSVPDMVAYNAQNRPTTIAWRTDSKLIDWRTFNASVNQSANALIRLGVAKGDAVAVLSENSLWNWIHSFGVLRAGGVVTPLNTMLRAETLAHLLTDAGANTLIVSPKYASLAAEVLNTMKSELVVLSAGNALHNSRDLSALADKEPDTQPAITLAPDDPFNIIYSSGTTGTPKGIVHTHGARARTCAVFAVSFRATADARMLLSTPPSSNGSWGFVLATVYVGGTTIVSSGFDPDSYLQQVRDLRPTLALMVPTMAHVLADHPAAREIDWSCFDFLITGGAPMPLELKQRIRALTGNRLGEIWGFTEGVGTVIQPREVEARLDSVGRALPECELRVIDENDREVGPGVEGELVGRSTIMMSGYHNRPDATKEIVWRSPEGAEFLRTGDIGVRDADGWVTIRGRKKEMIITGALNIYPVDIETVILGHEDVLDCAVAGVPHPKWGETPVAFVVLHDGATADPESLKAWVNDHLAKHQRLHTLVLCKEFPRNALGKVLRQELTRAYVEESTI